MNKKILLIGGGGHCKSVIDSLLALKTNTYQEIGIIEKNKNANRTIMGVPIIGCDNDLPYLYDCGYRYAFVTIGSIGNPVLRIKLFDYIKDVGFIMPNIIDPSAIVSSSAKLKQGIFIGKQVIINADATINEGAIINSGSIVEHDCRVGALAHIAPGVVLGGEVTIGDYSHIGSNATIKQQVSIGTNSIIGMGSVVTKDISERTMAYGNPCKEVKKL